MAAPWGQGTRNCRGSPWGQQDTAWQPGPVPPPQLESREGQRTPGAATALGIGHHPGDRDGPKLGWDMGPQVDPPQQGLWLGRAVGSWRLALL